MMFLGLLGVPAQAEASVSGPVMRLSHPGNGLFALHMVQYEFATDDEGTIKGRSLRLFRPDALTGGTIPVRYLRFLPLVSRVEQGLIPIALALVAAGLFLTGFGLVLRHRFADTGRRLHVTVADGMIMLKPNTRR
jgi:hypothetical protein